MATETIPPTQDSEPTQTPPQPVEDTPVKRGFMLSVDDITNVEPPPKLDPSKLTAKELIGDVPLAELASRMDSDEVREAMGREPEKPAEDDTALKVSREPAAAPPAPVPTRTLPTPTPAPQAAPVQTEEEKQILEALDDKQRAEIEWLGKAEGVSETFKGSKAKTLDYYKKVAIESERLQKEDPHTPIEENPDFADFIEKNKPKFSESDVNKVKEDLLVKKTKDELGKDYDDRLRKVEIGPRVEKRSGEYNTEIYNSLASTQDPELKELVDVMNKAGGGAEGLAAARAEMPEETEAVMSVYNESNEMGQTLIALREGLTEFNESNPVHQKTGLKVIAYEDAMKDPKNKQHLIKDGKQYVPTHEYFSIPEGQRDAYWTFSTDQILKFMAGDARKKSEAVMKSERIKLNNIAARVAKRAGYQVPDSPRSEEPATDVRNEAAESASVTPTRSSGADGKPSASADKSKLSFMMTGRKE